MEPDSSGKLDELVQDDERRVDKTQNSGETKSKKEIIWGKLRRKHLFVSRHVC